MNGQAEKFTGYVESLNIKGEGPNSHQCLFAIAAKSGEHKPFLLDTDAEQSRYLAMVSLLATAYTSTSKVQVTPSSRQNNGVHYVTEIELRFDLE